MEPEVGSADDSRAVRMVDALLWVVIAGIAGANCTQRTMSS